MWRHGIHHALTASGRNTTAAVFVAIAATVLAGGCDERTRPTLPVTTAMDDTLPAASTPLPTTAAALRPASLQSVASEPPVGPEADTASTAAASPHSESAPASVPKGHAPLMVAVEPADVADLQSRALAIPVAGVLASTLHDTFGDGRTIGAHEALDIAAPMRAPVRAVEDGVVAKLFTSVRGGITVYQFDPGRRFAYYYAHLDSYAPGLHEGQRLKRCELVGHVGVTGNSPAGAPHLHFAIFKLEAEPRWWRGAPINPFTVLRKGTTPSSPCPVTGG